MDNFYNQKPKKRKTKTLLILTGIAISCSLVAMSVPVGITISDNVQNGSWVLLNNSVTPNINKEFTTIGSPDLLFENNQPIKDIASFWQVHLNKEKGKSEIIANFNEFSQKQKDNISFIVKSKPEQNSSWIGTTPYETWSKVTNIKDILYSSKLPQLNITSLGDLHKQLNSDKAIEDILIASNDITLDSTNDYSLADSKIYVNPNIKEYAEIHIKEKNETKKIDNNINLKIPLSDLNVFTDLDVTIDNNQDDSIIIKEDNLQTVKAEFNVGIDSNVELTKDAVAQIQSTEDIKTVDLSNIKVDVILDNMGFVDNKKWKNNSIVNTAANGIKLNDEEISKVTNIYNVTYSNPELTNYRKAEEQVWTGDLLFDAKPNKGHSWSDGSTEAKKISIDQLDVVPSYIKDAYLNVSEYELKTEGNKNWSFSIPSSSKNTEGFKKWWEENKVSDSQLSNEEHYLPRVTNELGDKAKSITLDKQLTKTYSLEGDTPIVTYQVTPASGHVWLDGTSTPKQLKLKFLSINWTSTTRQ